MSTDPVKKTVDDYPPLERSAENEQEPNKFEEDESSNAILKDKQPAGDAGPEDAVDEKEKKQDPPY